MIRSWSSSFIRLVINMKVYPTNEEIFERILEEKQKPNLSKEVQITLMVLEYIFRPNEVEDVDIWKIFWNYLANMAKNKWANSKTEK